MNLFYQMFYFLNVFIFLYVVVVAVFYLGLLFLSLKQVSKYIKQMKYLDFDEMVNSKLTPPISVIVPAYNEEVTIQESVLSFLSINYPEYEVIVVNDGSTDHTLSSLIEQFQLLPINQVIRQQLPTQEIRGVYRSTKYPHLIVLDKENGGKADALNAGINTSNYPYFCAVDADSFLEYDALLKTMRPFIEGEDNVLACGGIVRIANGCKIENGSVREVGLPKNKIALHQVIEYLRSFLMGRLGFSGINSLLIVSGAFGVFRKAEVIKVGGYRNDTVGEDMELVMKLQRYIYDSKIEAKVLFVPDPVCWTEAPEKLKTLYRQRTRWHIGLLESLLIHKSTFLNPKYKQMGLLSMPYFLFVELLGPTIELFGFIFMSIGLYLGIINIPFAILYLCATVVFGIFLSLSAVLLEEFSFHRYPKVKDVLTLAFYSVIENFWYRQLNALWRTWAFIRFFRNQKSWGKMERKGISTHTIANKEELNH